MSIRCVVTVEGPSKTVTVGPFRSATAAHLFVTRLRQAAPDDAMVKTHVLPLILPLVPSVLADVGLRHPPEGNQK